MKTGIELIAIERQEQIEKHGWSLENDQCYSDGELIQACQYALCDDPRFQYVFGWPSGWDNHYKEKIWIKTRLERLIVAGALICAEIDRLNANGS